MNPATKRQLALDAFHTTEPSSVVAKRLGMSPNTLRPLWKDAFGSDAVTARGKKIQASAASTTAKVLAKTRTYKDVVVPCSRCRVPQTFKANQVGQMDVSAYLCDACKFDRVCPVCDQPVDGVRGLSGHFRHRRDAGDEAHLLYEQDSEDARWEDLEQDKEYVVCLECGHRAITLARHLKASHNLTADDYRLKHPGALIRSRKLTESRSEAIRSGMGDGAYEGLKVVECPSCRGEREVSKFLGALHDPRCPTCRAAEDEAQWEGKSEPEDYVECRLCGYKTGQNLNSHIQNAHPDYSNGGYAAAFPGAPFNTLESGARNVGEALRLHLTEADLAPFKDDKGRVQVALAAYRLGCCGLTVRRYCKELGLQTRNRLAAQKRVLDLLAEILGEPYAWEWWHPEIVNPATGYYLYFDGRFEHSNLVVEYQGKQHFKFIPYWHKTRAEFERRCGLDELKARRATEVGLKLLVLRYNEPCEDADYLRGRLVGVL
jgi:hypothetical protein